MTKMKFRKEKNGTLIVSTNGEQKVCSSLSEVWQYIFYQKFIAIVKGEDVTSHNDTLYPVNSLLPPVVEKVAKFYDLGAEIC